MVTEEQTKQSVKVRVLSFYQLRVLSFLHEDWLTMYIYIYLAHACALHILEVVLKDAHCGTLQEPNK